MPVGAQMSIMSRGIHTNAFLPGAASRPSLTIFSIGLVGGGTCGGKVEAGSMISLCLGRPVALLEPSAAPPRAWPAVTLSASDGVLFVLRLRRAQKVAGSARQELLKVSLSV